MDPYPAEFESDYVPERSRLTTFFRLFMLIPHSVVMLVYGLGAFFSLPIAWLVVVFTGRYPEALYNFHAGLLRWVTQVYGYAFLLTDRFPPFGLDDADYPVRVHVAGPQPRYDRVKAGFRLILALPWAVVVGIYSYVALAAWIGAWFAIVFTGRQPELCQRGVNFYLAPNVKLGAFAMMLTDEWPSFQGDSRLEPRVTGAGGAPTGALPAPEMTITPAPPPEAPAATPQAGISSGDPLNPS